MSRLETSSATPLPSLYDNRTTYVEDGPSMVDLGANLYWEMHSSGSEKIAISEDVRTKFLQLNPQFQQQEYEELLIAFRVFDPSVLGEIGLTEVSHGLVKLGQHYSLDEVRRMMTQTGTINFATFCRVLREKQPSSSKLEAMLRGLFHRYDTDRDGRLSSKEFNKFLAKVKISLEVPPLEPPLSEGQQSFSFDALLQTLISYPTEQTGPFWRVFAFLANFACSWDLEPVPKEPEAVSLLKRQAQEAGQNIKIVSFIRHGQSLANAAAATPRGTKGLFDPPLSELGQTQSVEIGLSLSRNPDFAFDMILVSPLARALETAMLLGKPYMDKGVKVYCLPCIAEQLTEDDDLGHPISVLKQQWPKVDFSLCPEVPEVWWYPGPNVQRETETMITQREAYILHPWEEPWKNLLDRADRFQWWIQQSCPGKNICVIAHGGFIASVVGPSLTNTGHCVLKYLCQ